MDTKHYKKFIMDLGVVIFANLVLAAGIVFFIIPSGLIMGGVTGLSLGLEQALPMVHANQVPYIVAFFNILFFLLGFFALGKGFAWKTLLSTAAYPVCLGIVQQLAKGRILTDDYFLCAVFGGLCIAVSLGLIIRRGASTGGTDALSLVLHKWTGLSVSIGIYVVDVLVLFVQMPFRDREQVLYGIITVIVYSLTLDRFIAIGESRMEFEVISSQAEAIRKAVLEEIDRGCTVFYGETGYFGTPVHILKIVVSSREIYRTERLITKVDPEAFVTLTKVTRVNGIGFSKDKRPAPQRLEMHSDESH